MSSALNGMHQDRNSDQPPISMGAMFVHRCWMLHVAAYVLRLPSDNLLHRWCRPKFAGDVVLIVPTCKIAQ